MRLTLPLMALAAIAAPAAAVSQPVEDVVTVRIAYGDVDLSTANGRAKLEQRIEAQARAACTIERNSRYGYGRAILDAKCVTQTRIAALAEVERLAAAQSRAGRQVAAN